MRYEEPEIEIMEISMMDIKTDSSGTAGATDGTEVGGDTGEFGSRLLS